MYKAIRSFLLHHLSEKSYIKIAKKYNDIRAAFKKTELQSSEKEIKDYNLPLVYISQPPRCGGTFTRNLLDGHSELAVYPYEISWEKNGYRWDRVLRQNFSTFKLLKDRWISHAINHGIDKSIPFHFDQSLQKRIFLDSEVEGTRSILGNYLSGFFNAWLNYDSSNSKKKYCVAFCPWTQINSGTVERYYDLYPDGFRIHVIRSPFGWWASEKSYNDRYNKVLEDYLPNWILSTQEGIQLNYRYRDKYLLISYESLVNEPQRNMKILCDYLGIQFKPEMLVPSLNGVPRRANSSHNNSIKSIQKSSLDKWEKILTNKEIETIRSRAMDLYDQATKLCIDRN